MQPRTISPLALAQLKAWERVARGWPVSFAFRKGNLHLICATCDQTVFPVESAKTAYQASINHLLSGLVAHLRNVHRDIESEVYGNDNTFAGQNTQPVVGARIDSGNGGRDLDPD